MSPYNVKISLAAKPTFFRYMMAERLKKAIKHVRPIGKNVNKSVLARIAVGDFEYKTTELEMGDLSGNRFSIVLRNICKEEDVDTALQSLKDNGFINYYGLQRFGNSSTVKTSDVGLALIKSDWKGAIEMILRPRVNEKPWVARARNHWWMYRHAADAFMCLGNSAETHSIEGALLNGNIDCFRL